MSERAQRLAQRFDDANTQFIALLEQLSENQWHMPCADETRTVGVVADHVAGAYRATAGWARAVAAGEPLPLLTSQGLDELNARHAERRANTTREETIARLRENGLSVTALINTLSDEQLDRTGSMPLFGDRALSAQEIIEGALIAHILSHMRSIKRTIGA